MLFCWGQNNIGQLGMGDTSHRGSAASHMGVCMTTPRRAAVVFCFFLITLKPGDEFSNDYEPQHGPALVPWPSSKVGVWRDLGCAEAWFPCPTQTGVVSMANTKPGFGTKQRLFRRQSEREGALTVLFRGTTGSAPSSFDFLRGKVAH